MYLLLRKANLPIQRVWLLFLRKNRSPFTVSQQGDTITVSTKEVKAFVLSSTGEVWFTDENGKMILQENKGGGKTFNSYRSGKVPKDIF